MQGDDHNLTTNINAGLHLQAFRDRKRLTRVCLVPYRRTQVMDEDVAYYREMAKECLARAERMSDSFNKKLHRAFAIQFEQYATAIEERFRRKAS
jgi:hypothetical protein